MIVIELIIWYIKWDKYKMFIQGIFTFIYLVLGFLWHPFIRLDMSNNYIKNILIFITNNVYFIFFLYTSYIYFKVISVQFFLNDIHMFFLDLKYTFYYTNNNIFII